MANSQFDLVLERVIDVAPQLVFDAWTKPEHVMKWFMPKPWKTIKCDNDLRPGGRFNVVMQSPEGEEFPYDGCYLEVAAPHRLVWTSALGGGYRPIPASEGVPQFTCVLTFAPHGTGTKYTATLLHGSEADAKKHNDMGFQDGWGAALDQLVEAMTG
jgi:uncharacterized protein YndB with AHSA1/START domain